MSRSFLGYGPPHSREFQGVNCVGMGTIIACAACIGTVERYEVRCSNPQRSVPALLWTLVGCGAALAICGAAVMLGATVKYLLRRDTASLQRRACQLSIGTTAIAAFAPEALIRRSLVSMPSRRNRGRGMPTKRHRSQPRTDE